MLKCTAYVIEEMLGSLFFKDEIQSMYWEVGTPTKIDQKRVTKDQHECTIG